LLIDRKDAMSVRSQCRLLEINRSTVYYEPKGESADNLQIMKTMDKHILEEPTAGVLTMQSMLEDKGIIASYERVRRLMRLANIRPIYPRRHLTKLAENKYVYPYLLRDLVIDRCNQVWEVDITYVPMQHGFMYLTAIIDVYSRFIVGWGISNSLDTNSTLEVVHAAILRHDKPEILNSDQGSQFTDRRYVELLKAEGIQVSMDGKGRALDNIYIERFWRTIKQQHIYLNPAKDGVQLFVGIKNWLERYHYRAHQGIERKKPAHLYQQDWLKMAA
jgi:putative transposase